MRGPAPGLRWPVVVVAAAVFGAVVWMLGSGGQSRSADSIPPDLEVTTSLASSDTVPGGEGAGSGEPNALPEGPLRLWEDLNKVRRVAAAPDGSLWLATDGGVIRWNPATGASYVFASGEELPATGVAGVAIGANGTVWAGSHGWIGRWDGAWTRFTAPEAFERPLAVSPDGVVWWGSSDGDAIGWFDGAEWKLFRDVVPLGSESIAIAPDGTVWAATASTDDTHDGVVEYDGSEWIRHGVDEGLPEAVGGSVAVTPDGTVWAGSAGAAADRQPGAGVARYDGSAWSVFTVDDGLAANDASVVSGPDGTAWAVAPEGLSRLDGSEWTSFPDAAGFGFGAVVDGSGVLWAPAVDPGGGIKGFDGTTSRRLVVNPPDVVDADADDGGAPLEVRSDLPDDARLDFLATVCEDGEESTCHREGRFLDPEDATHGTGVWAAGLPFHINQGFVNRGDDLLGNGFDVVVSITRLDGPELDDGAFVLDQTYRFHSDYVATGMAVKCGPGYWDQTDPQPCEWFVHDFPDGLPPGRYEIWVEWQAPCAAWLGLGLADVCGDPDEVTGLFATSVNMPFYGPGYWEDQTEPFDPYVYPEEITKGAAAS